MIQDVAPDGTAEDVTAGYLRASLREADQAASRPGAPELTCRNPRLVPLHGRVDYRVPLVPNARRFRAGHRIRLLLTSDVDFRHAPVGTNAVNTVFATSRLLLPVL